MGGGGTETLGKRKTPHNALTTEPGTRRLGTGGAVPVMHRMDDKLFPLRPDIESSTLWIEVSPYYPLNPPLQFRLPVQNP